MKKLRNKPKAADKINKGKNNAVLEFFYYEKSDISYRIPIFLN